MIETSELCREARKKSGLTLHELASEIGISHMSVLAWERKADPRLISYWQECGMEFPHSEIFRKWVQFEPGRIWHAHIDNIEDCGVEYAFTKIQLERVYTQERLEKIPSVYMVDEETGIYVFSKKEHWRRAVIISYKKCD